MLHFVLEAPVLYRRGLPLLFKSRSPLRKDVRLVAFDGTFDCGRNAWVPALPLEGSAVSIKRTRQVNTWTVAQVRLDRQGCGTLGV